MFKKAAVFTIILIASASLSYAKGSSTHHNNTQTTMIGSFDQVMPTSTGDDTGSSGSDTNASTVAVDDRGCSTLVTADIQNTIKKAGDITSTVSDGKNNQANAASVVITGKSNVSGSLMNKVDTTGDLTAIVEGGRNNIANAGTISVKGAVSAGSVMNKVKDTGDITSIVSDGRNNQANSASIAIN